MNANEAASEAVQGARVTCDYIGEGVYVDYQFGGWRINHPGGNSSGFSFHREPLQDAEWRIVEPEKPKPATPWGSKRIVLGEHGVPPIIDHAAKPGEASGAREALARRLARPNVGTAAAPSGFELARLEALKEAEPLPETTKPASPWGKPKTPWGPGK